MTKPETNLPDTNIDIVDCILCVKAAEPERALFSFDRDLNKLNDWAVGAKGRSGTPEQT